MGRTGRDIEAADGWREAVVAAVAAATSVMGVRLIGALARRARSADSRRASAARWPGPRLRRRIGAAGLGDVAVRWGLFDLVRVASAHERARAYAMVATDGGEDGDGSLEDAIRHPVTPPPVRRPPPRPLVVERSQTAQTMDAVRELITDHERRRAAWLARVPAWTTGLALVGVLLTIGSLVRPLEGFAPFAAIGGVLCVALAWTGARRR